MFRKLLPLWPILAVLVFAFFLRFWMIGSVAPGISIDEMEYAVTAKSFYLTGTDLVGRTHTFDALRFVYPPTDAIKAELSYFIDVIFTGPFLLSLPLARLPFVLFSVGIVLLLYGIGKELFDKTTGIIAALLGAINPFLITTGRTMYEIVPATFLYFLGMYILIKARGKAILLSMPVFLLAFYSYIGTKLIFVPLIVVVAYFSYAYVHRKKDGKYFLTVGIFSILVILLYIVLLQFNHSSSRLDELLLPNSPQITREVDVVRRESLPTFLTPILFNKATIYIKAIVDNLVINFSQDSLFLYGDGFFQLYNFGVLYYLDAVFILAGLFFLFSKRTKIGVYFVTFILISTIPQALHDSVNIGPSYTHSVLIFPFLIIIAAFGIGNIVKILSKKKMFKPLFIVVVGLYSFLFLAFFQTYFYHYPMVGKDDFPSRILARYITFATQEGKTVEVLSPDSSENFRKYLFYTNGITKNSIGQIKKAFVSGNIKLDNVSFISCIKHPEFSKNKIVIESAECSIRRELPHSIIPLISDGGSVYNIYPDGVCSGYDLKQYPDQLSLSLFQVERLSKINFCEAFITRSHD